MLRAIFLAASTLLLGGAAIAHEPDKTGTVADRTMPDQGIDEKARSYFTDTVLTTHDNRDLRFYSDVLANRTVVVNFMFTECLDACPLINYALEKVQTEIGDRMGEDIFFVSVSVDPETDTPEVLADYRTKFGAGDAWLFLTGAPEAVETVGGKMGQVFERDAHLTALLVGNTKTGRWRKLPAYLPPANLAGQITDIADAGGD